MSNSDLKSKALTPLVSRVRDILGQYSFPLTVRSPSLCVRVRHPPPPQPNPTQFSPAARPLVLPAPAQRSRVPPPLRSALPSTSPQTGWSPQPPGPQSPIIQVPPLSSAAPEARLFPLLPPPRPVLTQHLRPSARPTRRPRPHLPSNCWFLPPFLLSDVSRDRKVEATRARRSPPRLLPLWRQGRWDT